MTTVTRKCRHFNGSHLEVGRGRSPGPCLAAVGAWPLPWAPSGRRGGTAGPLGSVWPPWGVAGPRGFLSGRRGGVAGPLGPVLQPLGRLQSPKPRLAAVGTS